MTAHARSRSRRAASSFACAMAWALALPAAAIGLGDLRVHSALGEPLDATVALVVAPDAKVRAGCFSAAPPMGKLPGVPSPRFSVESGGTGPRLRIRTRTPVHEPAVQLRLKASCEGNDAASRDYEILLDPRAATAPNPPLRTVSGDTLASLAAAIYPRQRAAREAYLSALRAANPAVAGLADDAPIAPGTTMVLPDLRRFSLNLALSRSVAKAPAATRETRAALAPPTPKAVAVAPKAPPSPPAEAAVRPKPPASRPSPPPVEPRATAMAPTTPTPARPAAPKETPANAPTARPKAAQATAPHAQEGPFVLRLSAPAMDLRRSRGIDDRQRAVLRERLMVLDADDQVAALLSLRHNLKQLEGRVAELQLKLSRLPPELPRTAASAPTSASPAGVAPAKPVAVPTVANVAPLAKTSPAATTPVAPMPVTTPPAPASVAPASRPAPTAPVPDKSAGKAETPPPAPAPSARKASPAPAPVIAPMPNRMTPAPRTADAGVNSWLWVALAVVVALMAAIGWHLVSRRGKASRAVDESPEPASALEAAEASMARDDDSQPGREPAPAAAGHRAEATSDAMLPTRVPGADPAGLRRRYIEERFPEIAGGTIAPGDADSIVKASRLFYEDGALARAVELLQYSVEERPDSLKPWLALFEIFRLERLTGEFAELARRFRQRHEASEAWRKVQFIGREIDPGNPLYRSAVNNLETIAFQAPGPSQEVTFDPLAENWLNAPMDFTTDALAASLRAGLLADAGLDDADLAADPMPALKNIEMFNVA
jgi:pilus assembly protein FimV